MFVKLNDGPLIPLPMLSSEESLFAPFIRGHAPTIDESMGAAIPHVTLCFEENMSAPGCGHVAMTRVKNRTKMLIMRFPSKRFFRPYPLFFFC